LKGFHGVNWVRQIGTPARDLPQRQRTLENVVAWSYSLLTPSQQLLFCKLGLFSGWFDNEAVTSICFEDSKPSLTETNDLLGELSDQSLLVRDFVDGIPCWRMLELVHEYAHLKLDEALQASLRLRFSQHFLEKLMIVNKIEKHKQQDSFYHLNVRNLHAALKWAIAEKDTDIGFRLAWHLDDLWMSHGYSREGLQLLKQLFALPDQSPPKVRIDRLELAADLAWQKHDFETGLAFSKEIAELAMQNGIQREYLWSLNRMGRIYIEQGQYGEARRVLEECLAEAEAAPDVMNPGTTLAQLGELSLFDGKLGDAKAALEKAIALMPEARDSNEIFLSMAKVDMAEIALVEMKYDKAYRWLNESSEYADINIRRTLAFLFAVIGYLILTSGQYKERLLAGANLMGAIDALSERSGIILGSFYQQTKSDRINFAKRKLPDNDWQEAFLSGQLLSRDEALQLAKGKLKSQR
jgi:tetratricopeptide (TPR) repeat protein